MKQKKGSSTKTERCELCGRPEPVPVALEVRGMVKWICYKCYKERRK